MLSLLMSLVLPMVNPPSRPSPPDVTVQARQSAIKVQGSNGSYRGEMLLRATPQQVWGVLTAYDQLAGKVPDIAESRVLERQGNRVELSQTFRAPYTFGQRIQARLTMTESPLKRLTFQLVRGDFIRQLQGSWTLQPMPGGQLRLLYAVTVEPDLPLGKELFYRLFEQNVLKSLESLRQQMERSVRDA